MLLQIIKKEYRSGRVIDLLVMVSLIILVEYIKLHLIYILIFTLLPTKFLNIFWNHKNEKLFFSFIGSEVFIKIIKINKLLTFFELNLIFILVKMGGGSTEVLFYDLLIFNSYLLVFSVLSDYLFTINIIPNNSNYNLIINTFIVIFLSSLFSLFLMLFINEHNKHLFISIVVILLILLQVLNLVFFFTNKNNIKKIFKNVDC